jgi:hypothetical protein
MQDKGYAGVPPGKAIQLKGIEKEPEKEVDYEPAKETIGIRRMVKPLPA